MRGGQLQSQTKIWSAILWTPTFTPLSEQAQPLPTNWGFLLYERKEEFGTERASKVTLGRKTVEIREVSLFLPLHLQLWGGKGGRTYIL
jgi:hypothetical protein